MSVTGEEMAADTDAGEAIEPNNTEVIQQIDEREPSVGDTMREIAARMEQAQQDGDPDDADVEAHVIDDTHDEDPIDSDVTETATSNWELSEIAKGLHPEMTERHAANLFIDAVAKLQNEPALHLTALADTYLQDKVQAQEVIAHLAAKHGIDVFDVDVDAYQEQVPVRQAQQRESHLEQQLLQTQLMLAKQSGDCPLLERPEVITGITEYRRYNPGATILEAYNVAVHGNLGLSQEHFANVSKKPSAESKPKPKVRRAKASDLPQGKPGAAANLDSGPGLSVGDHMREIAAREGYEL